MTEPTLFDTIPTDLIGEWSNSRPECRDLHLPATYNPSEDMTWCWCGDQQWPGTVPTLHARWIHDSASRGATLLGYDLYWLPA